MPNQAVTIKDLIVAAAQGTSEGLKVLREAEPPIEAELQEFEIEVNYSCTTEWSAEASVEAKMRFWIVKARFSAKTSYKRTTTYGLKVRFVFTGKTEEESATGGGGTT